MSINTKKTCKDAKKSLTMHRAGVIDIFLDQYRPYTSDAGLEATDPITLRAFFLPLHPCFPAKEMTECIGVCGGGGVASVCLPASDEQCVLYLGHQLKVEAMLRLVSRGPASEHRVPP